MMSSKAFQFPPNLSGESLADYLPWGKPTFASEETQTTLMTTSSYQHPVLTSQTHFYITDLPAQALTSLSQTVRAASLLCSNPLSDSVRGDMCLLFWASMFWRYLAMQEQILLLLHYELNFKQLLNLSKCFFLYLLRCSWFCPCVRRTNSQKWSFESKCNTHFKFWWSNSSFKKGISMYWYTTMDACFFITLTIRW